MTESETESKEIISDSESKLSEPDENKIDEYLVQIRELEDALTKLENLPQFDPKYKKNRKFLEKLELPKAPTWTAATRLYGKITALNRKPNEIVCTLCHAYKARSSRINHRCKDSKHSFHECPSSYLIGNFSFQ